MQDKGKKPYPNLVQGKLQDAGSFVVAAGN